MNLVSIIIPCYNYGWLLAETLDSVLAQTHQQWECLVIDDGSTDTTQEVATSYQARDSRFRYVYQPNAGMSAARNHGMQLAKGEYIQFLDADDLLVPQKLELQAALLATHPEYDVVYGAVRYFVHGEPGKLSRSFDLKDTHWQVELRGQGSHIVKEMVIRNTMVMNAPLLRAALVHRVGHFQVGMHSMEDWEFWLRCALANAYFFYDDRPETWALVRVHPTSVSQNRPRMRRYEQNVRQQLVEPLRATGLHEAQRLNALWLEHLRYENAVHELKQGQIKLGITAFWELARESGNYLPYSGRVLKCLVRRIFV